MIVAVGVDLRLRRRGCGDLLAALVARGLAEAPKDPIPWGDEPVDSSGRQYTEAEGDELVAWCKGDH